jgi:hypothetical protein
MADAQALMKNLGLRVSSKGPSGRYPCADMVADDPYRYWATMTGGEYWFGVQSKPKKVLSPRARAAFEEAAFNISPNGKEAYVKLGDDLDDAVSKARAAMARIRAVLNELS